MAKLNALTVFSSLVLVFLVFLILSNQQINRLESQIQVLSHTHTVFGFTHGQCNYTSPNIPCNPNLTYLCEEQGKLYSCNSPSGWFPFFDIAMASGNATSSFSNIVTSFVQPACDTATIITLQSTAWIAPGMVIYIQGGGYYIVSMVIDGTMVNVVNPCFINNTISGTTVPSGGIVTPGGQQGPPGLPGPANFQFGDCNYTTPNITCNPSVTFLCLEQQILYNCNNSGWFMFFQLGAAVQGGNAYSNTIGAFIQPNCYESVSISIQSSAWISRGMVLYIAEGGYYIVESVTPLIISNPCFFNNSIVGTVIGNNSLVSPGGQQGPTMSSSPNNTEIPTTVWARSTEIGTTIRSQSLSGNTQIVENGDFIYSNIVTLGTGNVVLGSNVSIAFTTGTNTYLVKYDKFGTAQSFFYSNSSSYTFFNIRNNFIYNIDTTGGRLFQFDIFGNILNVVQPTRNTSSTHIIRFTNFKIDYNGDIFVVGNLDISGNCVNLPPTLLDFGNNVTFIIESTGTVCITPFLVKYNSSMIAQWVNGVKYNYNIGGSIAYNGIDIKNANIYIIGALWKTGNVIYDFGNNITINATAAFQQVPVLVKYDYFGNAQWVKIPISGTVGLVNGFVTFSIGIDENENIYYTQQSGSSMDFGNNVTFFNPGWATNFIVKYNSSGVPQWVVIIGALITPALSTVGALKISNNNIYIAGSIGWQSVFVNTFFFGNNVNLTVNTISPFIAKFNLNGVVQWAKSFIKGPGTGDSAYTTIDVLNNTIYVSGTISFNSYNNYGNGIFVAGNSTSANFVIVKYQE